jgi:iron complex transport system substrate-binding protein
MFLRWILLSLLLWVTQVSAGSCPPGHPRIVSQSPYITRAIEWLDLEDCIVGVSRYDQRSLPRTGGVMDPDAKAIAKLAPQLMITSTWTTEEVWLAAAPPDAIALRVGGFRGMDEVEEMLHDIGRAAGIIDINTRVAQFVADWHAAAERVEGRGQRVLILSACGRAPYSFGRGTTLHELFTRAGFQVVADHDGIRNFLPETPDGDVGAWISGRHPEFIFALKNRLEDACNPDIVRPGIAIVPIEGDLFTHPGPGLVEGLKLLRQTVKEIGS